MSVELEWELYDIFDSGTFAFPIYDHNSARRIVRYLLMRGILHEEIAEAIEDSTTDLNMWMNRHGKHKIGEWVIAWINDCREDFDRGELHKMGEEDGDSEFDHDLFMRIGTPESDDGHHSAGDDTGKRRLEDDGRSDSRITDLESISSQAASRASAETLDKSQLSTTGYHSGQNTCTMKMDDRRESVLSNREESPPPPLPPRTVDLEVMTLTRSGRPDDLDFTKETFRCTSSQEGLYEPPDSGHFSDLYTAIPSDSIPDTAPGAPVPNNVSNQCTMAILSTLKGCQFHNSADGRRSPSATCTCSLAHYSCLRKKKTPTKRKLPDLPKANLVNNHSYCDIYESGTASRAMEFDFETLDKDGPGFIFIMTDSIANCLPWSSEHRYKIASSRQPDRCLLEFRTRNIDVDLIWQVKVKEHLKAVREIHKMLINYNLHSNWFKCSLSLIMDTVSRVVKHYK